MVSRSFRLLSYYRRAVTPRKIFISSIETVCITSLCTTSQIEVPRFSHIILFYLCLGSEAKARALGVEDDILALEEDITEDGESNARVALDTTVAGGAASGDGSVVDQLTGNNRVVAIDVDSEVRQGGGARESVATDGVVVLGTRDLLVVGSNNGVIEQKQSGSGV